MPNAEYRMMTEQKERILEYRMSIVDLTHEF